MWDNFYIDKLDALAMRAMCKYDVDRCIAVMARYRRRYHI
jgi:hypothetical protein